MKTYLGSLEFVESEQRDGFQHLREVPADINSTSKELIVSKQRSKTATRVMFKGLSPYAGTVGGVATTKFATVHIVATIEDAESSTEVTARNAAVCASVNLLERSALEGNAVTPIIRAAQGLPLEEFTDSENGAGHAATCAVA